MEQSAAEVVGRMNELLTGFWVSQAVHVAAKLGVADHIQAGGTDVNQVAQKVQADPEALYRLLRALASVGVFNESAPRRFSPTPLGDALRTGTQGSMRALAMMIGEVGWEAWGNLHHGVRTGETVFPKVHGQDVFAYLQANPEKGAIFNQAMGDFVTNAARALVGAYDFSRFSKVVDVGGGNGTLVRHLLQAHPALKAVVFDLPFVVESAKKELTSANLATRAECVGGDFFEAVPAGGDAYVLASIVHDWNDEQAVRILERCRAAMRPGSTLLLVEMVLPTGNQPFFGKWMDLQMLTLFGGRERTEEQYRALLARAGFTLGRVVPTPSPASVLEAVPA